MKRIMVRYKVKPDRVGDNETYVRAVFAALQSKSPPGFRYATFKLPDGVSFVHVASIETPDGSSPLPQLAEFKAFTEAIRDRCDEPPVSVDLTDVGSYRFFGD